MALLQKFKNKTVVPWFNRNEWYCVYKFLYSIDSNYEQKKEALNILKIWKTRTPHLPAGLEGTYIILQVTVDHPGDEEILSHHDIQILYSTAIMRFLNICVTHDSKQGTFFKMARKMKIPDWIISLRHDAAHSSNVPPLALLQKATSFAFEWLYNEYWYPISLSLADYNVNMNENECKIIEEKLQFLISVFESIIVCRISQCNIKKIIDIPDVESRQQILNDLQEYDRFPKVTEKTHLKVFMNILNIYICNYFNDISIEKSNKCQLIVNILINGDTFLCAPELIETLLGSSSVEKLPWNFVKYWQNFFFQLDILDALFLSLIKITTTENESHIRKSIACLWIIELAKAINHMHIFSSTLQNNVKTTVYNDGIKSKLAEDCSISDIQSEYVLMLNINHDLPTVIKNLDIFQQLVLEKPTKYTKKYLPYLLNVIKPPLSNSSKDAIQKLVNVYVESTDNLNNEIPKKIYSGADFNQFYNENGLQNNNSNSEIIQTSQPQENDLIITKNNSNQIWEKVSDNIDFSTTPLGLLPWQQIDKNPTLVI